MARRFDLEEIADCFSEEFNYGSASMSTISRCDFVVIKEREILFIEETNLDAKDLTNPRIFAKEVIENVKKMWGSLSVFVWLSYRENLIDEIRGKDRIYILSLGNLDGRTARAVSNLIKTLKRYRDGGFSDVKFIPTPP